MSNTFINPKRFCNHRRSTSLRNSSAHRDVYHRRLLCEPLEDRRLLDVGMASHFLAVDPLINSATVGSATPLGYTPQHVRAAYGIDSISLDSVEGTGAGQTIAIICAFDNPNLVSTTNPNYLTSDLHHFNDAFGLLDPPSFRKLDQNGGTDYPSVDPAGAGVLNWETESALDVEWAHAIAPQANIVLVEANSTFSNDIAQAISTARNIPGVSVISMSLGWTEDKITPEERTSLDALFTTPAGHQGITYVAGSGDDGSPGMFPAFSSNVLAVGGTSLLYSYGTYSESAWSGSGGGQSTFENEPAYQQAIQNSGKRQSPDVSILGDNYTPVSVYDSYNLGSSTPWGINGGTSLSAPCWAGLIAIANQLRVSKGLGTLDGPTQTLPGLYALPPSDFNDITSGANNSFSAGVGYDQVTGLGSPIATKLVPDLAMLITADPLTVTDTMPLLTEGTLATDATQLSIHFSEPVIGGDTPANFELRSLGADGLLGTTDDVIVPLTISYDSGTTTLSFSPLPASVYRLIVRNATSVARHTNLDGDGDGVAGGDWAHDFVVLPSTSLSTLTSPHSILFDVASAGSGQGELVRGDANGTNALNGYGRLTIDGTMFASNSAWNTADDGQSVVSGNGIFSGLNVSRKVTVPNTGNEDFARTVDSFTNPTIAPITTTIKILGNLGSDAGTTVFTTSNGDTTVDPSDQWIGTDGNGTPALIHYIHSLHGLKPSSVGLVGDNIQWTYNITVQPGQTVELAYFTIVSSTREKAITAANALVSNVGFGGQAAAFLSSADKAALGNFQFPVAVATVSLDTQSPKTTDKLTATATKWAANDTTVSLTFVWAVNGIVKRTFTTDTALTDTFDLSVAGNGNRGDTVTVSVTPNDGTQAGTTATATATVIDTAPSVSVNSLSSPQSGAVTVGYQLTDADSDLCSILVQYSLDGGATWNPTTIGSGGDGLTGLASSPNGTSHSLVWESDHDIVNTNRTNVSVRITPTDTTVGTAGATSAFTIKNSVNLGPTDLALSNANVAENLPSGTAIGTLSSTDPNTGDTFTYSLVAGDGSTDNAQFAISGNTLQTTAALNYESKNSYSVRIRSTDQDGLWTEKSFAVAVTNVNELPSVTIHTLSSPQSGDVAISYVLVDPESDPNSIVVQYSLDGGATWNPATNGSGGDGVSNLDTSPEGVEHTYIWDSETDIGQVNSPDVLIQIVPSDADGSGTAATTDSFAVENQQQPTVTWQDTIGLFAPTTSKFFLRNTNEAGVADASFNYGPPNSGWKPIVGDWDKDVSRQCTIGLYNPTTSVFYLHNTNDAGAADLRFQYGPANVGWLPIVGDWDGNGTDTVGLFNPTTSVFYLHNTNDAGAADLRFQYGPANVGWLPIIGDWDGDGTDSIGLYNPTTSKFYLHNTNEAGPADATFVYGPADFGWKPIAGDWDKDGTDTIGLYNPTTSKFYLHNSNDVGVADLTFQYGPPNAGWTPIVGDWNGSGSPLRAAGNQGIADSTIQPLRESDLQPLTAEAIARWTKTGISPVLANRLKNVQVVIADLPGSNLGLAVGNTISIDRDAAGHGWFVDPTPADDEEFSPSSNRLSSQAVDRIDLLTVLEHELGHTAGLGDLEVLTDDIMSGVLGTGTRRNAAHVDAVLASLDATEKA